MIDSSQNSILEVFLTAVHQLLAEKKLNQAKYFCQQALQLDPNYVEAYQKLGDIWLESQQWQDALICYEKVTKLQPNSWEGHHRLGETLLQLQQWEKAIAAYSRAIELNPNFFWSYYHQATAFGELDRWQAASVCCQKMIALEPNNWEGHHRFGETLLQLQQWEKAIVAYSRAIELNPDFFWTHYNLGTVFSETKQWERAIAAYRRAIELEPDLKEVRLKLANALKQKAELDLQEALTYYRQEIECNPQNIELYWQALAIKSDANIHFQLGNLLLQRRDLDRAIVHYRQAIAIEPENIWYYKVLGDALTGKYELEEAIAAYDRAIQLQPNFEECQQNLDKVLQQKQQWQRIIDYCDRIKQLDFNHNREATEPNRLKILMITPYPPYPPQKGGGSIRMFEQIKYFGSRHHLTVVSYIFDDRDEIIEQQLAQYCDFAVMVKLGVPMQPDRGDRQHQLYFQTTWNMWKILEQFSQIDFDVVLFDFIFSTTYHSLFSDRLTVLNEHNIESKLLQQCTDADVVRQIETLAPQIDAVKCFVNPERESQLLATYENQTWSKFSLRTVVSNDDRQELASRCQTGKTIVIKNGIDIQTITLVDNSNSSKILYMGTMVYYPNIDAVLYFVEQIFSKIKKHIDLTFCVAGNQPPTILENLAVPNSRIEVIANPKDMSEIAKDCMISVVPLRLGGGTRIKILHSMAMGLPVVSTSLGCEGLEVIDGVHLLIRDDPEEFARAILQLYNDASLRNELRKNGRNLVEQKYDWQSIFAEYEREILAQIRSPERITGVNP
jgi:tetratricopeptide (TPR) repeat protein